MRGTPTEVNRALVRPILFCGVEGRIALVYGVICFALLIASRFHFPAFLLPVFIFMVAHGFFMWIAKKDSMMVSLYRRHIRYRQGYFPARSGVNSPPERIRPSVYLKEE